MVHSVRFVLVAQWDQPAQSRLVALEVPSRLVDPENQQILGFLEFQAILVFLVGLMAL